MRSDARVQRHCERQVRTSHLGSRRTRPSHSRSPSPARAPCSAPRGRPRSRSSATT